MPRAARDRIRGIRREFVFVDVVAVHVVQMSVVHVVDVIVVLDPDVTAPVAVRVVVAIVNVVVVVIVHGASSNVYRTGSVRRRAAGVLRAAAAHDAHVP